LPKILGASYTWENAVLLS